MHAGAQAGFAWVGLFGGWPTLSPKGGRMGHPSVQDSGLKGWTIRHAVMVKVLAANQQRLRIPSSEAS